MAYFFSSPGSPPAVYGSVRYQYHTPDGGPPNDGKPPAPAGPPPPYSPFPFGAPPSAPPGPFAFCGPPPASPSPAAFCCSVGPPAASGTPPSMVCWSSQPPEPPKPVFWASGCPPAAPRRSVVVASSFRGPHPPDPGNRVNNRVVKADDGTGVLCSEDMTTFHVLSPGRWFHEDLAKSSLQLEKDFTVQHVDSDWSVQKFIRQLGGLYDRLSPEQRSEAESKVCVEEWHEAGNGKFERGSSIYYNNPKARMALREIGWGPAHGKAGQKPPVWLMLYPVNEDRINK